MHQTSKIRVLSDRIPRALVFVYFCRGLSENMERRPTCQVYNEIITCHAIFLNLEDSRSHGNERETGLCSTDLKDQGKPCDQCRFDPTSQIHLKGLYKQGLSTPGGGRRNHYQRKPSKLGF